jgi:transposase-like protein
VRSNACKLYIPLVPADTESLSRLENRFAALQILSISLDIDPVCALHPHSPNHSSTQHLQVQEVYQTHALSDESRNAWCREHGLFAHQLAQWQKQFCAGSAQTQTPEQDKTALRALRLQNAQLQRQLARKDRALAEAAALLVLQKKFQALCEDGVL